MPQTGKNNKDQNQVDKIKKPASNERAPGQGNSSDGLTRRLGPDVEQRGKLEKEKLKKGEGKGEDIRTSHGSQGMSKGQKKQ